MDHFIHKYQTRMEDIMQEHDYLILDNIFPVPLYRKEKGWTLDDVTTISRSTTLAAWWERVLQEESGKIVLPQEIYKQALQGYGIVTQSRRNFPSFYQEDNKVEEQRSPVEKYLGTKYSLLVEAKKHSLRLTSKEHEVYTSVAAKIRDMTLEYHLKKENHHDDKGVDESLAAAASYFSTQRSARCAIITNDRDIDRIVDRCLSELDKKLVTVYHPPRMENYQRHYLLVA